METVAELEEIYLGLTHETKGETNMVSLNSKGVAILKDFLVNNHNLGLLISHDVIWFNEYVNVVQLNKGKLALVKNDVSSGGCYLLDLEHCLEAAA